MATRKSSASLVPWLAIAAVVVVLDQLTKTLIVWRFALGDSVAVTPFLNIVRAHNTGAAFSLLAGASGWQRWFFVGLGAVAAVFIVWMLSRHGGQRLFATALALILGGALGNVIDRLLHGHVVDFVQVHHAGWYFPSFNVADSAITLGAACLILDELLRAPAQNRPVSQAPSPAPAPPAAAPDAPPPPSVFDIRLNALAWSDPIRWLAAGWRDFRRAPGIGLFYGGCFALMGWLLLEVFEHSPAWTLALSAGFLLAGPLLCLGLYDASRRLERGERPDLGESLTAWDTRIATMAIFGAVLLVLEMVWARASLVVFALSFDGMPDFKGSLRELADPKNVGFIVAYTGVGSVFAALIYAVSVVSMPMILDRGTDAIAAGLTSIRLCLAEPGVMLLWGALITLLVVVAMLPGFLGLLVVGPVLGHASWHAYRAAVAR